MLNLPGKSADGREDGKHYSWNQIAPGFKEIEDQARRILETKPDESQRDAFDRGVLKLRNALTLYLRLKNMVHPQDTTDFAGELATFKAGIPAGVSAVRNQQNGQPYDTNAFNNLLGLVSRYNATVELSPPLILPPHPPERGRDEWTRMGESLMAHVRGEPLPPAVDHWARISDTFRAGDAAGFNTAVEGYKRSMGPDLAADVRKGRQEFFFNQMAPFYDAMVIYVAAFLFALFYWFQFAEWSRRTAFALVGLAFTIHTVGLIYRMVLEGVPGDQPLFVSHFHRLGLRAARDGPGAILAKCDRAGGRIGAGLRDADHCAQPGAGRGHDGDAAGRAGHQFLARDPRGHRDPWLREHLRRRVPGHRVHPSRRVHARSGRGHRASPVAHGLRHHLLRHAVQFHRDHSGWHLGRPELGTLLGLGPEGKRRTDHRPVECPATACALGGWSATAD